MKAVKRTQTKLKNLESIKIKGIVYEFVDITYKLKQEYFFTFKGIKIPNNKELCVIGLLKTLYGYIENTKFTYETLNNDLKLKNYLRDLNVIEFINITSLRINNKKYFNFIEEKSAPIGADFSVIQNNLLDEDMNHYDLEKLLNTCIIT